MAKPRLTGRDNALTRGKGKKYGLKGMAPRGAPKAKSAPKPSGMTKSAPPISGVRAPVTLGSINKGPGPISGVRPAATPSVRYMSGRPTTIDLSSSTKKKPAMGIRNY